jgi:hypothetical protein
MALIKKKTRKKLVKGLKKLVRKHGAEVTLTLVTGIVGALVAESTEKLKVRSKVKLPDTSEVRSPIVRKRQVNPAEQERLSSDPDVNRRRP